MDNDHTQIRIGCVRYLNSRPLIYRHEREVQFQHPSELADSLTSGHIDVGLIPIFELIKNPTLSIVDEVGIACRGPVDSVILVYRQEDQLSDLHTIHLDPASRTSAKLLPILLAEFHNLRPRFKRLSQFLSRPAGTTASTTRQRIDDEFIRPGEGILLIGDQAIDYRYHDGMTTEMPSSSATSGVQYLDLGTEWLRCTGLPFLFAAWLVRPNIGDPTQKSIASQLRNWREEGSKRIVELSEEIESAGAYPTGFVENYLLTSIRFQIGKEEKEALLLYASLLAKHGFVNTLVKEFHWI